MLPNHYLHNNAVSTFQDKNAYQYHRRDLPATNFTFFHPHHAKHRTSYAHAPTECDRRYRPIPSKHRYQQSAQYWRYNGNSGDALFADEGGGGGGRRYAHAHTGHNNYFDYFHWSNQTQSPLNAANNSPNKCPADIRDDRTNDFECRRRIDNGVATYEYNAGGCLATVVSSDNRPSSVYVSCASLKEETYVDNFPATDYQQADCDRKLSTAAATAATAANYLQRQQLQQPIGKCPDDRGSYIEARGSDEGFQFSKNRSCDRGRDRWVASRTAFGSKDDKFGRGGRPPFFNDCEGGTSLWVDDAKKRLADSASTGSSPSVDSSALSPMATKKLKDFNQYEMNNNSILDESHEANMTESEKEKLRKQQNNARERVRVRDINEAFKELSEMVSKRIRVEKPQTKLSILQQAVFLISTLEKQIKDQKIKTTAAVVAENLIGADGTRPGPWQRSHNGCDNSNGVNNNNGDSCDTSINDVINGVNNGDDNNNNNNGSNINNNNYDVNSGNGDANDPDDGCNVIVDEKLKKCEIAEPLHSPDDDGVSDLSTASLPTEDVASSNDVINLLSATAHNNDCR